MTILHARSKPQFTEHLLRDPRRVSRTALRPTF